VKVFLWGKFEEMCILLGCITEQQMLTSGYNCLISALGLVLGRLRLGADINELGTSKKNQKTIKI